METTQLLGQMDYGFLALIPAIVAIFLAFKTKNVYIALSVGLYSGIVLMDVFQFIILGSRPFYWVVIFLFAAILQIPIYLTNVLGDPWNGGIVLQVLFIGGLIHLISYTGGAKAIAAAVAKKAKSPQSSQFYVWVMGLIVFFDDYANALIIGPIMRPIVDKMKISREKFAFIIDATAAPIAGLAIISTWIGYELGLISTGLEAIGIAVSPFVVFVESIPFRFYNILILAFILLTIFTKREFGEMLKVEKMARAGLTTPGMIKESDIEDTDMHQKEGIHTNIWDGIIPLFCLIVGSLFFFYVNGFLVLVSTDTAYLSDPFSFLTIQESFSNANAAVVLFQAAVFTMVIMFIRAAFFKQFTVPEGINVFLKGANTMLSTVFILLFAWSLGVIISDLGASDFLVSAISESIPFFILPAITFGLSGLIAYSTGTSYGTMGIMMPLVIALAADMNPEVINVDAVTTDSMWFITLSISSVLTGATFGDHCSPISDTTILSSMGAGCDHIEHVRTQMGYALLVGAVSTIAYIFAALGLNYLVIILLGILSLYAFLRIKGEVVE